MQMTELKDIMKTCGIVGAGGAGFPSYAKLDEKADVVILNCAECEPLFRLHRQLLSKYTSEILKALDTVREAVGAKEATVAVKTSYSEALEAVEEEITVFKNIRVARLPEIYPAGDEVITVYEATGRVIEPGKLPISQGVIVYNVETMLNTYYALKEARPVCYKYVTVAGEVGKPQTLRVPLGITFKQAVELAGGERRADCVYLSGGVMTGKLAKRSDVITKTTNAVLVLPQNHPVVLKKKTSTKVNIYRAMSACCQCRMCTDLCSRNLLGHPIEPHAFMRAVSKGMTSDIPAVKNIMYCSQCKLCEMYACQQGLSPGSLIGVFRDKLRQNGIKPDPMPRFAGVNEQRSLKRVPMERLIARLGISDYDVEAPISEQKTPCRELKLLLTQHIGQPAKACVKVGDIVEGFAPIAHCEGLGADIHSPCRAEVLEATAEYVKLKPLK